MKFSINQTVYLNNREMLNHGIRGKIVKIKVGKNPYGVIFEDAYQKKHPLWYREHHLSDTPVGFRAADYGESTKYP